MAFVPPTGAVLRRATGADIAARCTLRKTSLSIVERIAKTEGTTAILKTVHPALRHEARVHELAARFRICAARLLATSAPDEDPAWLLIEDLGEDAGKGALLPEQIAQALIDLAALHRHYAAESVILYSDILRCDSAWLEEMRRDLPATFAHLQRVHGLDIDGQVQRRFDARLAHLAETLERYPLTLVHGDFDPGNLARLDDDRVAAFDWGLGHANVPLVDLAHMIGALDAENRIPIVAAYLEALDLTDPYAATSEAAIARLVELGDQLHKVFFIRWHSRIVVNGWGPAQPYLDTLQNRILAIAQT